MAHGIEGGSGSEISQGCGTSTREGGRLAPVFLFVWVVPTQIHVEFHGVVDEGVVGEESVLFEGRDPVRLVRLAKELSDPLDRRLGLLGRLDVVVSSVGDVRFLKEFGQARLNGLASMPQFL